MMACRVEDELLALSASSAEREAEKVVTVSRLSSSSTTLPSEEKVMILRDDGKGFKMKFEASELIEDVSRTLQRHYHLEQLPRVKLDDAALPWRFDSKVADVALGEFCVSAVALYRALSSQRARTARDAFPDPYQYSGCFICYDAGYWRTGQRTQPKFDNHKAIPCCAWGGNSEP